VRRRVCLKAPENRLPTGHFQMDRMVVPEENRWAEKADLKDRLARSKETLKEQGALYRALLLARLPTEAGKILREADRMRFLGD
jgi:hypothetical protein